MDHIPAATLEALAKGLCREADEYGFKEHDYLRFVNAFLDAFMSRRDRVAVGPSAQSASPTEPTALDHGLVDASYAIEVTNLPIRGHRLSIRSFDERTNLQALETWLATHGSRGWQLHGIAPAGSELVEQLRMDTTMVGVIEAADERTAGAVALFDIDLLQRKAELRQLLSEPFVREDELSSEATRLWMHYGTEVMHLNKIYVNSVDTTVRSIRSYEELGFTVEGLLRNELVCDGEHRDVLRLGYTARP